MLLATGGSGGHIYPAIALATGLAQAGVPVHFTGESGGPEERLSQGHGFPFHGLPAGKLDRQRPNPLALLRASGGVLRAVSLLRRLRPALVIGFGGFASLPGAAAAALTRTPLWLHEQNSYPGLVTRLLGRRAERVIVTSAAARRRVRAREFSEVPYPVSELRIDRLEARERLGLPPGGLLTLVMGGSQGSVALNDGVLKALGRLGSAAPLTLHATGPNNEAAVLARSLQGDRHFVRGYVDGDLAFAAADLGVTRAGTGTLAMAAFHGVPLVMVPLPSAAENHQYHNALAVQEASAGVLLPQDRLDRLADVWSEVLEPERLETLSAGAMSLSPAGARDTLVRLVLRRLHGGTAAHGGEN